MSILSVVVGGQFGSEGKGAVTAHLAKRAVVDRRPTAVIRVAGPNAGHTAIDSGGRAWPLRQIPAAAVTNKGATLLIGPGSEVDLTVLEREVLELDAAGFDVSSRLVVDGQATVLDESHIATETDEMMHERLGSTGKGIGAARAARLMRRATIVSQVGSRIGKVRVADTAEIARGFLAVEDGLVLIEGTQGYGLGLHAGFYPYCTSSDCRATDFLAMAGLTPTDAVDYEVWVTARMFPIRVAGNSGPLRAETSWAELGLPEERTTVTKKVRRVGHWDPHLIHDAVVANGGDRVCRVALTMFDQRFPEVAGRSGRFADAVASLSASQIGEITAVLREREGDAGAPIALIGTGPDSMLVRS